MNSVAVEKVADIGGGFGHLAVALLEKYNTLQACVVDVPDLIPVAKERFPVNDPAVANRLEYVGGDMFDSVPPANVYVMKHIIHDWEDDKCIQLLKNCHRSMQGDGRVICVDSVLPPMGDVAGTPAKLLDINMLVFMTGKQKLKISGIICTARPDSRSGALLRSTTISVQASLKGSSNEPRRRYYYLPLLIALAPHCRPGTRPRIALIPCL